MIQLHGEGESIPIIQEKHTSPWADASAVWAVVSQMVREGLVVVEGKMKVRSSVHHTA